MRIDDVPQRVAILGGGYIAAEFAHIFSAFGATTTVILRGDKLTKHLDREIAAAFTKAAAAATGTCGSATTSRRCTRTATRCCMTLDDGSDARGRPAARGDRSGPQRRPARPRRGRRRDATTTGGPWSTPISARRSRTSGRSAT